MKNKIQQTYNTLKQKGTLFLPALNSWHVTSNDCASIGIGYTSCASILNAKGKRRLVKHSVDIKGHIRPHSNKL